jgi:hypothetical protein
MTLPSHDMKTDTEIATLLEGLVPKLNGTYTEKHPATGRTIVRVFQPTDCELVREAARRLKELSAIVAAHTKEAHANPQGSL